MWRVGALMMGWLAINGLTGTAGYAAACPQDSPQQRHSDEAQPKKNPSPPDQGPDSKTGANTPAQDATVTLPKKAEGLGKRFLVDQEQIWTSPAKLGFTDLGWIVPAGGVASTMFFTDKDTSGHLSKSPSTLSHYKTISDASVAALLGGAAGMWLLSYPKHNEHWRETGFLAGEAALNSLVVTESLKYSLGRQRPYQGDGSGPFFQHGTSFPSEHAAAAWSAAGVIAHEYPGPLVKIGAYALAGLVDYSRIRARQHFPSDVFIGSMIGNMVGQSVYSRHHDPELGGDEWLSASQFVREHWKPAPESMGSPNVPLDSWIYPAFERLAAQGLVQSEFLNVRPWTRLECVGLLNEAESNLDGSGSGGRAMEEIVAALHREFASELHSFETGEEESYRLESMYTRMTGISGTPLTDSYHFGQTIYNDEGRPYQEGFNDITGFSSYATLDRFALYYSGEFQHAPSAPAYPLAVRQAIANADSNPLQPATPFAEVNRFTIQNAYLNTNIDSWNFSFGKQDLWWSPAYGSALLFSNNAEPIYMFRLSRVTPFTLPWILRYLGPMKVDLFFGRMQGNEFPPRPLMHGEKITFKPTENLELGFSRTVEFGGIGRAMTLGAIWHSYTSFGSSVGVAANVNPGHRVGGFDFTYRLPRLRNWLTLYGDSMTSDDPSPIDAPRRAPAIGGLHLAKFPGVPKLDLRVEGVYTDTTTSRSTGGQFSYWELFYHDAYTNKNFLMGSWIGREGVGYQAWSTYSFTAKSSLQFGFRHSKVDGDFIPDGVTLNDGSVKLDCWMRHDLSVSALVQYEKWRAPLLAPTPQTDWTSSVGITFWPRGWSK
jgi:membrane-associated phospholipid phosphatase